MRLPSIALTDSISTVPRSDFLEYVITPVLGDDEAFKPWFCAYDESHVAHWVVPGASVNSRKFFVLKRRIFSANKFFIVFLVYLI